MAEILDELGSRSAQRRRLIIAVDMKKVVFVRNHFIERSKMCWCTALCRRDHGLWLYLPRRCCSQRILVKPLAFSLFAVGQAARQFLQIGSHSRAVMAASIE
jgi:hypothetical protein